MRRGEQERFRRRDLLHALKNRREQIQQSLKRSHQGDRDALLAGSSTAAQQQRAKETEATAELDNKGLVQLQQQIMQQQDHELEQMEKTVVSTKVRGMHMGMAWGDTRTRCSRFGWWLLAARSLAHAHLQQRLCLQHLRLRPGSTAGDFAILMQPLHGPALGSCTV